MECTNKHCPAYGKCLTLYRGSRCKETRDSYGLGDPLTNADRIRSAKTEEELMECIFHALKMSRQYNDSRIGMVEWLKGTQWSYPIIEADKEDKA